MQVDQGEGVVFSEPRPVPASRTAPKVDANPHAVAFTYGEGTRAPITPGVVLAVLFAKAAAGDAGQMPAGERRLTAAPLTDHAARHGDRVRAFLDTANTTKEK
ncbi:hypothetical protein ACFY3J_37070 [Streptomyces sp. NPDC001231]|uniref:hypothetical protein n=1 Tax=Streptomyces sp. NPDC001231 TaxID=3364549 RepID=UPI00369369DF